MCDQLGRPMLKGRPAEEADDLSSGEVVKRSARSSFPTIDRLSESPACTLGRHGADAVNSSHWPDPCRCRPDADAGFVSMTFDTGRWLR